MPEQDHRLGRPHADPPRETLGRAGAGHQPEPNLRRAEPRARIGDDEVADERDLEPASHRMRLHRRDDRLRERLPAAERAPCRGGVLLDPLPRREPCRELLEIRPREERLLPRPGEDDGAHVSVAGERDGRGVELVDHVVGERVDRGVVDGDDRDGPLAVDADGLAHRASS